MIDYEEKEGSRIVVNETDFDRFLTILETPPKLSPETTARLQRKRAWEE